MIFDLSASISAAPETPQRAAARSNPQVSATDPRSSEFLLALSEAIGDQRSLVQKRHYLLRLRRHVYGHEPRRDRGFPGADAAPRLSQRSRRNDRLADALPADTLPRRRLRRRGLLRRRPALWHDRRFRRIHPRGETTWDACADRPRRQSYIG